MDKDLEDNSRGGRRKFSCLFVVIAMVFGLTTLIVLGFVLLRSYIHKAAFKDLTAAERAEFNHWAYTPMGSTPFVTTVISEETIAAKQQLKDAALAVAGKLPQIRQGRTSIVKKLDLGDPLTPEEWDAVSTYTVQFAPVVDLGREVIKRSDFALAGNQYPKQEDRLSGWTVFVRLLCVYIEGTAQTGDWSNSINAVELASRLARTPPDSDFLTASVGSLMDGVLYNTARRVIERTSETLVLRRILQVLSLNNSKPDNDHLIEELPVLYRQMQTEGYVPAGRTTQISAWYTILEHEAYLKWLVKTLPPSSPRKFWAKEELESAEGYYGSGPITPALKAVSSGPAKPLLKPLIRLNQFPNFVRNWYYLRREISEAKEKYAYKTLFLIQLARRIARLEGKPLPIAADNFVPEYMPHFPEDAFSTGPLSYSESRDDFYSVGPDGTDSTADDIYWPPGP